MRTRELQENWLLWLEASERLQRSLHEQTVAITLRDADRIERLVPETKQMQLRLKELEDDLEALTRSTAHSLGTEATTQAISASLEKTEAQSLNGLANRAIVAGRTVEYLLQKNAALVNGRYAVVVQEDPAELNAAA